MEPFTLPDFRRACFTDYVAMAIRDGMDAVRTDLAECDAAATEFDELGDYAWATRVRVRAEEARAVLALDERQFLRTARAMNFRVSTKRRITITAAVHGSARADGTT